MKVTGGVYFVLIIIALMLAVIVISVRMEYTEAKVLPLIMGGGVLILALIA